MNKNALLKNLGLGLIILSVLLSLIAVLFVGDLLDQPLFTWGCAVLVVLGLIAHILLNKYLPLDDTEEETDHLYARNTESTVVAHAKDDVTVIAK